MKLKKIVAPSLAALSVLGLVACGGGGKPNEAGFVSYDPDKKISIPKGYTSLLNENENPAVDADGYYTVHNAQTGTDTKIKTKKVYKTFYQSELDKEKFNYLVNNWTYNSDVYANMVDGLVENDKYGNIVGGLAYAYKTEEVDEKQVWTFKLRKGVEWVTNNTEETKYEVKADDFVAGLEYVLDPIHGSGTVSIVTNVIDGSADYYKSLADEDETNDLDFAETVGVKAVDDYTVEFTLSKPTPYFLTSLTYSPFLPVCREYLDEIGSDFGASENHILVNGPYRLTTHQQETKLVYTKNAKYWDRAHVYVDTIEQQYYSSSNDLTTTRQWYESGVIDAFSVQAKDTEGFAKYVTGPDNTGSVKNPYDPNCNGVQTIGDSTYIGYFNFVRTTYEYNGLTPKTEAEKSATAKALLNVNFRKAFLYGINPLAYLDGLRGEGNGINYLMRGYTNRDLCSADGKDYADYVEDVYNQKQGTTGEVLAGINRTDGKDPVFNATKAETFLKTAKTELKAAGLSESDFPIKIDVIGDMEAEVQQLEAQEYAALNAIQEGGKAIVEIRSNVPETNDENTDWGSISNNYDFSMWSGWGPDYADPNTFLHTMAIGGDMVEQLGFDGTAATASVEQTVLGAYDELYRKAAAITDGTKLKERYQAFAEAEYALIYEYAIVIPWYTASGYVAQVSKVIPYQVARATYGLSSAKLKNVIVAENALTKEVRTAVRDAWNAGK